MATDEQAHAPRTAVTVEILRDLLGSEEANLVLEGGRISITSDSDGLVLITRAELRDRIGADPDPTKLAEQADLLNTEVRLQGA